MDFMTNRADPSRHTAKPLEVKRKQKRNGLASRALVLTASVGRGELTSLASESGTPFKAAEIARSSFIVKEDAEKLSIPDVSLFSSQGGSPEQMAEYGEALKKWKDNEVESYAPMQHGWNAARADFENKEILKHFERGYKLLANFFTKHLEHRFGPERTSRIANMKTPSSDFA